MIQKRGNERPCGAAPRVLRRGHHSGVRTPELHLHSRRTHLEERNTRRTRRRKVVYTVNVCYDAYCACVRVEERKKRSGRKTTLCRSVASLS